MRYAVRRYWEVCDTVEVEANSAGQALQAAHAMSLDNTEAAYVPDSINSDPTCDVQPLIPGEHNIASAKSDTEAMRILIVDLYGDGESLRVCEDKAGIDPLIAEFTECQISDEHFDEFMNRKGVQLFITRRKSLSPTIYGSKVR